MCALVCVCLCLLTLKHNHVSRTFVYGGQVAEWLRSQAINQKVVGSIPVVPNDVVSLGTSSYPYCKSLWIRASTKMTKCKCLKNNNLIPPSDDNLIFYITSSKHRIASLIVHSFKEVYL